VRFWDSSAVVPLAVEEATSRALKRPYADDPDQIVWWATEIECVSAIARRERSAELTEAEAREGIARLEQLVRAWTEIEPGEIVRRTAKRLLSVHDLRAADAIQLAAALVASENRAETLELVTIDERLADAARREGFPVLTA
jgi:hypothetical protein